jgi:hypothetical protein
MKRTLITTLATLTALALAAPSYAAEKKMKGTAASAKASDKPAADKSADKTAEQQPKAAEKKPAVVKLPYQGEIAALDPVAKTFIIKNRQGKEHTFTITDATVITKPEGPGSFDDVKVGEFVRGSRLKTGEGKWDALSVVIGKKEETAKAQKVAAKTSTKLQPVAAPPEEKKAN